MPHQSITSLIYVSTARPGLDQSDVLAIRAAAQRNNQRSGVTGLILFNGFNFMQCIEGERSAARDCLHRIERDDRHSGMTIVSNEERSSRQFAEWRMAGQYLPLQSDQEKTDLVDLLLRESVADATRNLFQSFLSIGVKAPHP